MIDYMFNELSVKEYDSRDVANERMALFVRVCRALNRIGFRSLRLHEDTGGNLYNLRIAENYQVSQWIEQHNDRAITNGFRELVTSAPLINEDDPSLLEHWGSIEYTFGEEDAHGLGAAHYLDTIAVSLKLDDGAFLSYTVDIQKLELNEALEESTEMVSVMHACEIEHAEQRAEWYQQKLRAIAEEMRDLWENRETYFPALVFCGETEQNLSSSQVLGGISRVVEKLQRLNQYAAQWEEGGFSTDDVEEFGIRVSMESESTMENRRLRNKRRFRLPNDSREIFEPHIKAGDLRFHFFAEVETHTVYVGYIGPHLPTSNFQ
jgi:hypothetical protein